MRSSRSSGVCPTAGPDCCTCVWARVVSAQTDGWSKSGLHSNVIGADE